MIGCVSEGREAVKILLCLTMNPYGRTRRDGKPVYFDKIFHAEYPLDILAYSSIGKVTNA